MDELDTFHMTPDAFRRHGKALIDWIADYHERVAERPVLSQVTPGDIRAMLPGSPPERGEPFADILADIDRVILPGITHWQSPNFFAYFPANVSGPSILGELLSAGLGVQGMLWATSPACTELETHVMDWLVELLDLPAAFRSTGRGGGVIQDTASNASLVAMLAAREQITGCATNAGGCAQTHRPLVAYTSAHAHSSIQKAAMIAGIGADHLRAVATDDRFAMRPDALEAAIRADRDAGRIPFYCCATVGTTSSHAIDPLPAIGAICRDAGVWLHVDAAMAGTAAVCPELRFIHDGLELAQSYCFNPHKWMFTNFDCSAFWVTDREPLIRALSVLPEYLKNQATASGAVIDYRDWQIPLGRRFRALKLWFVMRHYGAEGLRHHVRQHVALAQRFAAWVDADDRFERAAPTPLNLVCFRHRGGDAINQALMDRLNASGRLYLTHTKLADRLTLRMSIGQAHTQPSHVQDAWDAIRREARELEAVGDPAGGGAAPEG